MENEKLFENRIDITPLQDKIAQLKQEIGKVIVGQDEMISQLITAILTNGHVLIEGVPGIAKTLSAKLVARTISAGFSRIQFTPDLMPSDIIGTTVYNNGKGQFEFNKGPVFSNIILIDEINRSPAKTQAALFEVMEERQVTVDGTTYPMKEPFLVFATQNPIEHEGTYRLPEAQIDRFLFRIKITYPTKEEECNILLNADKRELQNEEDLVNPVLSVNDIISFQKTVQSIHIEPNLTRYIADIIHTTRNHPSLFLGGSPRASLNILISSKAYAAIQGRDFVTPEDIHNVLFPVLNHRLYLTPEKELEGSSIEQVIADIVKSVEVPK
jgi:MoxR-like ATPase